MLDAARYRQQTSPGELFEDSAKHALEAGYEWFERLGLRKLRTSRSPAKVIETWSMLLKSKMVRAANGCEYYAEAAGIIHAFAEKFEGHEGLVSDEPAKGNSAKEQFNRTMVMLERLVGIVKGQFQRVAFAVESALETASEGQSLEQICGTFEEIESDLAKAMPRQLAAGNPPLAFLFAPNEDEPLIVTYNKGCFACLDKTGSFPQTLTA